jgi:hypothetical protein
LARPAIAQTPPPAPLALPAADTYRESRGRLEEMKVEMAWLADPATFPYPMLARTVESRLELRGSIPNEACRQAAIRIARAHTHLPVVDTLQIDRGLPPSERGVGEAAVRQGAVEVLSDAFGASARGFDIRAEADGKIAVSGSVGSVEEKLAVSRRLRKVRGCTYASNYLQISPEMRDGRMVTRIDAAGTLVVSGQVLCLDGTGQDSVPLQLAPPAPAAARPEARAPRTAPMPAVMAGPSAGRLMNTSSGPAMPVPVAATTIRPAAGQAAANPPAQAPVQAMLPSPVMPIEVPVPAVATPVAPPMRPLASDRVPPPSKVPGQFDQMTPGPVQAQAKSPVPSAPPTSATLSARDTSGARTVSTIHPSKEVDLLTAPGVPDSWNRDAQQTQTGAKSTTTFGTSRPPATNANTYRPTVTPVANNQSPAAPTATSDRKSGTTVSTNVPAKPVTVTPMQTPPATAPGLPLPVPPPTAFKDTWVEAMPAPGPKSTSDHPVAPPGGWPAAHTAQSVPTAYVTSGVVVFQDETPPPARPAPASHAAVSSPATGKPVAQLVSRIEPVSTAPEPSPAMVRPQAISAGKSATTSASRMKELVEQACGRFARRVEVTATDYGLVVHVKCPDAESAQKCTERVLVQVQEMSDTKVKFEVEVAR